MDREVMDQDRDQDWARDLFDKARDGGGEPVWTADHVAIGRAGDKRRRVRTLGAGGGVLSVVAITTAVALTLANGPMSKDAGKVDGPQTGGWGERPLSKIFTYANLGETNSKTEAQYYHDAVPQTAAQVEAAIIGLLDPSLSHLRSLGGDGGHEYVSQDADPKATDLSRLVMESIWTTDGVAPTRSVATPGKAAGEVSVLFASDSSMLVKASESAPDTSKDDIPCGYGLKMMGTFGAPPWYPVHWSKCARNDLSDGSKIDTASASNGAGTVTVAIREFPDDRGGVAIMAWNYPEFSPTKSGQNMNFGGPPDPSTVIKPSPFTEQQLADALADPSIKLGLTSDAKTGPARGFLQAADLGPGWTFDPVQSRNATGGLQMDNGCAPNKSMFGSGMPAGRTAYFQGRLPSGAAAAVDEAEYPLPKGTGASTMALAKAQAQGGCDPAPGVEFSKDAVAALPSGIGDDAFVQDDHGDGQVRIVIRFGDTIVETFVTEPPTAATPKVPDLSSPVDKTWLTSVARQIAVRWTAQ